MSIEERLQKIRELKNIVREELDKGHIEGYGEGLIKTYFRGLGITVSRPMIYQVVKELDEEGYKRRKHNFQRRKKEMIIKGPDWSWALDQHDKIAFWGFQIYAAIDGFSRKVIWVYVGISNRTPYSVLAQYLHVVGLLGYHPRVITTDKGKEVPFLAEVHYALSRAKYPLLPFEKVFRFGTSPENQRIESWWGELEKSQLYLWRVRIFLLFLGRQLIY